MRVRNDFRNSDDLVVRVRADSPDPDCISSHIPDIAFMEPDADAAPEKIEQAEAHLRARKLRDIDQAAAISERAKARLEQSTPEAVEDKIDALSVGKASGGF